MILQIKIRFDNNIVHAFAYVSYKSHDRFLETLKLFKELHNLVYIIAIILKSCLEPECLVRFSGRLQF